METDDLDKLFNDLKGNFDIENPNKGHEERFLNKLDSKHLTVVKSLKSKSNSWKVILAIAASVIICFGIVTLSEYQENTVDLASISPELSEAQDFFSVTIETELKKLHKERSPLTENIINDALKQLETLEADYANLKIDLKETSNDKRIIYAMISNFQTRIDLLENVLDYIDDLKQLKHTTNDTKHIL